MLKRLYKTFCEVVFFRCKKSDYFFIKFTYLSDCILNARKFEAGKN